MTAAPSRIFTQPDLLRHLQAAMYAETLDELAGGFRQLFEAAALPFHSLLVSFNGLECFCPWLVRDTIPEKSDLSDVLDRYDRLNPTTHFLRKHPGVLQSRFEDHIDAMPSPQRQSYLQRFQRREGWRGYAEIHFWHERALQATVCVRRAPGQPDFTDNELRVLAELRDAFAPCIHHLHRRHRERLTSHCLQALLAGLPIPILLLDWNLKPVFINGEARSACARWLHGETQAQALKLSQFTDLPREVIAACEQERTRMIAAGFSLTGPRDRFAPSFKNVAHPARRDLSAQIEVLDWDRDIIARPSFLVRFQGGAGTLYPSTGDSDSAPLDLAPLSSLTPSERAVALLVRTGMSNQDIATQLNKSVPTVKMHLQSIFRKLGVVNRTQIAARLR